MEKFQNKYRIPSARLPHWDYGHNAAYFITICTHNMEHYFGEIKNDEMHLNEIGKLTAKFWMEIPTQFPFAQLDVFVIMPNHMHGILIIDKNEMGGAVEMSSANNVETRFIASLSSQSQSPSESPETIQTRFIDENVETRFIASPSANDVHTETRLIASLQCETPDTETRLIASLQCESPDTEQTRFIASPSSESPATETVQTRFIASPSANDVHTETRLIASLPASPIPPPAQSHAKGGITGHKNPMLHENISRILRWYKGRCTIEIHKTHPHFAWQPRFHDHVIRDEKSMDRIRNYIFNNPYNWKKDKFHS